MSSSRSPDDIEAIILTLADPEQGERIVQVRTPPDSVRWRFSGQPYDPDSDTDLLHWCIAGSVADTILSVYGYDAGTMCSTGTTSYSTVVMGDGQIFLARVTMSVLHTDDGRLRQCSETTLYATTHQRYDA